MSKQINQEVLTHLMYSPAWPVYFIHHEFTKNVIQSSNLWVYIHVFKMGLYCNICYLKYRKKTQKLISLLYQTQTSYAWKQHLNRIYFFTIYYLKLLWLEQTLTFIGRFKSKLTKTKNISANIKLQIASNHQIQQKFKMKMEVLKVANIWVNDSIYFGWSPTNFYTLRSGNYEFRK